ncbi:hypothetical protein, partial [Serratia marcescens]|uniref:hypothetical protein n=1 Tax=Serratia marcescens TaxID=615 RepID=UPI001CA3384A
MLKWGFVKTKSICIFALIIFMAFFIAIAYEFPMRQFISIIEWDDTIEYSKASIMCVFGLPSFLIVILFFVSALF